MLTDFQFMVWRHRIYPTGILHLGGHLAEERDLYAKYCSGPTYFVEALPKLAARIAANISPFKNQHVLCACVSDVDGQKVQFNVTDNKDHTNNGHSSSILKLKLHSIEHPDVKVVGSIELTTVRVDTLLAREGIEMPFGSFLSVDLQGAEGPAIRGMIGLLPIFEAIYCEFNEKELYENCTLEPELDALLEEHGFETVERFPTRHGWGDKLFKKKGNES